VSLDDVFDDGQAQPRPTELTTSCFVYPIKAFKEPIDVSLIDPDAAITHRNGYTGTVTLYFNVDTRTWFAVLDRIVDKVDYCLLKQWRIDTRVGVFITVHAQFNSCGVGIKAACVNRGIHD